MLIIRKWFFWLYDLNDKVYTILAQGHDTSRDQTCDHTRDLRTITPLPQRNLHLSVSHHRADLMPKRNKTACAHAQNLEEARKKRRVQNNGKQNPYQENKH
jgi:hypothetical protein